MSVPFRPSGTDGNERLGQYPQIRISRTPHEHWLPREFCYRRARLSVGYAGMSATRVFAPSLMIPSPSVTLGYSSFVLRAGVLELRAQVAYVEKRQVGLLFLFRNSLGTQDDHRIYRGHWKRRGPQRAVARSVAHVCPDGSLSRCYFSGFAFLDELPLVRWLPARGLHSAPWPAVRSHCW